MTSPSGKFDALDGYLAGNFADADLAGLTDEQAAVAELNRTTLDWHRSVLREGRAALGARQLDWQHIADYANRTFTNERQAHEWLTRVMDTLERGIERL